ncbi:MAG: rhodanese-like domain-containing protein [Planctomycetota bacterium]
MTTIDVRSFQTLLGQGEPVDVVDVRTPAEYREVHVVAARSVPLDGLTAEAVRSGRHADAMGPIYLLCKAGGRARQAAEKLSGQDGSLETVVVEGGTDACVAAGLDVERGQATMSLERQVRIAAGALVAAGTVVGVFVTPWALILPAFVGCGLVFAGISNTCGMGMLLAKMPWNR